VEVKTTSLVFKCLVVVELEVCAQQLLQPVVVEV
jgi:hypothetical protein